MEPNKVVKYSLENPRLLLLFLLIAEGLLGSAVAVSIIYINDATFMTRTFAAAASAIGSVFLVETLLLIWNNSIMKPRAAEKLASQIPWGGDETVAEVGCGNGLIVNRAVSRLSSGRVVGIDVFNRGTFRRASSKAAKGGATNLTTLVCSDSRSLPMKSESFEIAISGFGTRRFRRLADRILVVDEMVRVLKPGGFLALMVTEDPIEAIVMLKEKSLVEVMQTSLNSFLLSPTTIVTARKTAKFD